MRSGGPAENWQHRKLYDRVLQALEILPTEFETDINIVGIHATDLHSFNTAIGAAIEQSVVENLNKLRSVWDPEGDYRLYRFIRHTGSFPDVRLEADASGEPIIMGIELKGWFALAKEGEPSFRYVATPTVCASQDLLVVYPWVLREVVSGHPQLLKPFVVEARYAAEMRNYYWSYLRGDPRPENIRSANYNSTYPKKSDRFNDEATDDSGGNFGRVSRSGIMKNYITKLLNEPLSGIPLGAWQRFIKIFSEGATSEKVTQALNKMKKEFSSTAENDERLEEVARIVDSLESLVSKI